MKKTNQSIFDSLLRIYPDLVPTKDHINPTAAKSLFNIWKTSTKLGENMYKRPATLALSDVQAMKESGLARQVGDKIEITEKGAEVIRIMVLGDDRSCFEDSDIIVDYNTALRNTKNIKVAKQHKAASWWDRFEEDK